MEAVATEPDLSWLWNLGNTVGVLGALVVAIATAWRGREPKANWSMGAFTFSGMENNTFSQIVFMAEQLGPGTAERVTFGWRAPGAKVWDGQYVVSAIAFGKHREENPEPRKRIEPGDRIDCNGLTVMGNKNAIPRGTWLVRLEWYEPRRAKPRVKTWKVEVDTPLY